MKKYVIFILFVTACSMMAVSQNKSGDKPMREHGKEMQREKPTAEQRAQHMAKELDLTAKQQKEVQTLFEKIDTEWEKQRTENKEKMEAKREEMKKNREAMEMELKNIIGDEKFEQWKSTCPNECERKDNKDACPKNKKNKKESRKR